MIAGLESVVAGDPENVPIRLHLAELLLGHGEHDRALAHAVVVLSSLPDHAKAARLAADCADRLGDARAASYRRLADALLDQPESISTAHEVMPGAQQERPPQSEPAAPDSAQDLINGWADIPAPAEPRIGELIQPGLTLNEVAGMDDVKRRLELSLLAPIRNPEVSMAYGKRAGGGLLLWGPPGCGKTFVARACAGELGAAFYSIGTSDVLDMWIGASEQNLTSVFEVARRNPPCMLFFDELDSLGRKRTQLHDGAGALRGVVNQFLSELDGVGKVNDGVFVMGATNHPWDIDSALVRPGRFDRMMLVLPPDPAARTSILRHHLDGRPTHKLDLEGVAARTEGLTGADLALVCDSATERAMERSMDAGKVEAITMRDMKSAMKEVRPSTGPWFETARNYAMYSNESGQFDELLAYMKGRR